MAPSSLITALRSLFVAKSAIIRSIVIVCVVFGLESIVSEDRLLKCPSEKHNYEPYGWLFIFLPAAMLFFLSLFLSDGVEKAVQGCCYSDKPDQQCVKGYTCSCPRWYRCSKKLCQGIFYGLTTACLWIFWAFLQGEYYTCAKLGNKKARLFNQTDEKKKQIEEDFTKAGDTSQMIGVILFGVFLAVVIIVLTVLRCCCQPPFASIPKASTYEKLEAISAAKAFKDKMEGIAEDQGRRKADLLFSEHMATDRIFIQTYNSLKDGYPEAELLPFDQYENVEAEAAVSAFKAQVERTGKEKTASKLVDNTWNEFEQSNPRDTIQKVYNSMVDRYPRSTGDQKQPYILRNQSVPVPQNGDRELADI